MLDTAKSEDAVPLSQSLRSTFALCLVDRERIGAAANCAGLPGARAIAIARVRLERPVNDVIAIALIAVFCI